MSEQNNEDSVQASIGVTFYDGEDGVMLKQVVLGAGLGILIEFGLGEDDIATVDVLSSKFDPDELVAALQTIATAVKELIEESKESK